MRISVDEIRKTILLAMTVCIVVATLLSAFFGAMEAGIINARSYLAMVVLFALLLVGCASFPESWNRSSRSRFSPYGFGAVTSSRRRLVDEVLLRFGLEEPRYRFEPVVPLVSLLLFGYSVDRVFGSFLALGVSPVRYIAAPVVFALATVYVSLVAVRVGENAASRTIMNLRRRSSAFERVSLRAQRFGLTVVMPILIVLPLLVSGHEPRYQEAYEPRLFEEFEAAVREASDESTKDSIRGFYYQGKQLSQAGPYSSRDDLAAARDLFLRLADIYGAETGRGEAALMEIWMADDMLRDGSEPNEDAFERALTKYGTAVTRTAEALASDPGNPTSGAVHYYARHRYRTLLEEFRLSAEMEVPDDAAVELDTVEGDLRQYARQLRRKEALSEREMLVLATVSKNPLLKRTLLDGIVEHREEVNETIPPAMTNESLYERTLREHVIAALPNGVPDVAKLEELQTNQNRLASLVTKTRLLSGYEEDVADVAVPPYMIAQLNWLAVRRAAAGSLLLAAFIVLAVLDAYPWHRRALIVLTVALLTAYAAVSFVQPAAVPVWHDLVSVPARWPLLGL